MMKNETTAIADRLTETATTEDGRMLHFNRALWAWVDDDTGERVQVRVTWINLETNNYQGAS